MSTSIDDRVLEFYEELFERIFTVPFLKEIERHRDRGRVRRQIEELASAASQSLHLFFSQLEIENPDLFLNGIQKSFSAQGLEDFLAVNNAPEVFAANVLEQSGIPNEVDTPDQKTTYRLTLTLVSRVLITVCPILAEWRKFVFAETYEIARQLVGKLNSIAKQLEDLEKHGQGAVDENFELIYRNYLLQRFSQIEAGTVRITTNLSVDLQELFVMPRVRDGGELINALKVTSIALSEISPRLPSEKKTVEKKDIPRSEKFQGLEEARQALLSQVNKVQLSFLEGNETTVWELLEKESLLIVIGVPGVGKSTLLEWIQLQVASGNKILLAGGQQAIPILLRIRTLDPTNLPTGRELIAQATFSDDIADKMPDGWVERQMKNGTVLVLLDGLDEVEPKQRDTSVLPWFRKLCEEYPDCRFVITSRPVGYPSDSLDGIGFMESNLLDFNEEQILEYVQHWHIAVRLVRNEPTEEARRKGIEDGETLVAQFKDHPYTANLARTPLMLSAICLVNFFEGGELPKDRALLYKLCVEGLLHHWDQRRGIQSKFSFSDKLKVCREVAIFMQHRDKAEVSAKDVLDIVTKVMGCEKIAVELLEHIRYRTGLLMERRPGVFAFAHLTFQEYLAALAIHEGNLLNLDSDVLIRELGNNRWREVIVLYSGLTTETNARFLTARVMSKMNEKPTAISHDHEGLEEVLNDWSLFNTLEWLRRSIPAEILAEVYLAAEAKIKHDITLRNQVLRTIADSKWSSGQCILDLFPSDEVRPIAIECTQWDGNPNKIKEVESRLRKEVESRLREYTITQGFVFLYPGGAKEYQQHILSDLFSLELPKEVVDKLIRQDMDQGV